MRTISGLWRNIYNVRPGERIRTLFMFLYLLLVLFAYYILKPVSQAMFLNKFKIDDLPYLIILVAVGAGILAYAYSKVAVRISLSAAVSVTMLTAAACLMTIWWLLGRNLPWMLYAFNIFVGIFSVVLVAQGWLVASNVFNAREARRIYPLLGMALVTGAALGGEFTRETAVLVGTRNLVLASAALVLLAYAAFLLAAAQPGISIGNARATEGDEESFSVRDVVRDLGRSRHLQVIIAMMAVTYIVDVLVTFQFQSMAKAHYHGDQLTVFLGSFYGLWLNLAEFAVQFLVTAAVVSRFGVGGTLGITPLAILLASFSTALVPSMLSTSAVRLTEACSRYTLNKTGMELLYMPLPRELRNRLKAFIDIFFDRMSRGVGGLLLVLFTRVFRMDVRQLAMVVIGLTIPWTLVAWRARKEYIATIRGRLAARHLELASPRVSAQDRETIALLEETAAGGNVRQASYALALLGGARGYHPAALARRLAGSPFPEVRAKAYELARESGVAGLEEAARAEIDGARDAGAVKAAAGYLLAAGNGRQAAEFLNSASATVAEAALEALAGRADASIITVEWVSSRAAARDAAGRKLAANAIAARGGRIPELLHGLLDDDDPEVARAACQAAGALRDGTCVAALLKRLSDKRVRGAAIEALAQYGPPICAPLENLLEDTSVTTSVRRQVPRVLKRIPCQRSVDALVRAIGHEDLAVRAAVLKALNRLRESAPGLDFDNGFVTRQIYNEARYYFELSAALNPLASAGPGPHTAAALLVRSIQERLRQALERVFRLLGLRYPPREIYSTYLALASRRADDAPTAMEFLDTVLDQGLKKVLIPLLDAPEHLADRARDLYGVDFDDGEAALRELIRSRDPWLVACSIAAVAELGLRNLAPEIARAAEQGEREVGEVARAAQEVLA